MPAKLFSDEQIAYLREITPGRYNKPITELLNEKFGTSYTEDQVKNCRNRYGIRSGKLLERPAPPNKITTKEQNDWLRANAVGKTAEEIRIMIKQEFGIELTPAQVKGLRGRHGINNGIDCRFKKGQVAPNKGVKMSPELYAKCAPTMFKKGHVPRNHRPVGSERVSCDGYIEIKVAEPNIWELKHRVVWEAANGPIPDDSVIIFADGDKQNLELGNLLIVDRGVHGVMNYYGMRSDLPDITKVNVKLVKLKLKKFERLKELKNEQK